MHLAANELGADRGGDAIFRALNFAVHDGQALMITGPNGAGKSTLLRVVAGLISPVTGRVDLFDDTAKPLGISAHCHYIGHTNAMKPALSVSENLQFWQRFLGSTGDSVASALEKLSLPGVGHLPYAYLSTGQKRRVAMARLLTNCRPLWLLDEPTSGLDQSSCERFAAIVDEHLQSGGIVVAATHHSLGLKATQELKLRYTV